MWPYQAQNGNPKVFQWLEKLILQDFTQTILDKKETMSTLSIGKRRLILII